MTERTSRESLKRSALIERIVLACSVIVALLVIVVGFWLAHALADGHWVNRAGAAVVAIEAAVGAVEIARQRRLGAVRVMLAGKDNIAPHAQRLREKFLHNEMRRAERQVLFVALSAAVIGELLHGFGDLLFKLLF